MAWKHWISLTSGSSIGSVRNFTGHSWPQGINVQTVGLNLLVAISILVTGRLSFFFASVHDITPVWAPSGIALAALLVLGWRVSLGILAGYWMIDTLNYQSIPIGSVMALGETSEAVLAALIMHRLIRHHSILEHTRYAFYFAIAATLAPIFNTTLGTFLLYLKGIVAPADYLDAWKTWWTADTVGILIFTPFLLSWLNPTQKFPQRLRSILIESSIFIGLLALTTYEVFFLVQPLEYLYLPLVIWAAFRFGQRGTTSLLVCISSISIIATAQGLGTFVQTTQNNSLILLQSFVGVLAVTGLLLCALITERATAENRLKQANETLEHCVEERTAELSQALVELQRAQAQLVQTEKMSSLGQLVAGVAHEINNPINFIHGNLYPAQEYTQNLLELVDLYQTEYPKPPLSILDRQEDVDLDFIKDDLPKLLESMKVGSDRIRDIVKSLRNFSRLDEAEFKTVDIHEGIDSTLMILQNRLKSKSERPGIEVIKDYGALPLIECFPGELNQVFMNILTNAIDALEEHLAYPALALTTNQSAPSEHISQTPGKTFSHPPYIKIRSRALNPQRIQICIADNGAGMSETVRSRLFDPFYTTKPVGVGTGLGLSISYQIITTKHQGSLICHSAPGAGAEFVIELPTRQTAAKVSLHR